MPFRYGAGVRGGEHLDLTRIQLRELRYFVHVAELKSFTRASVHLRIAQPALSRQVRKLEDDLGVQLLVRTAHGVELTDAGMLLLERSRSILRQVSQTLEDVREQAGSVSGTITLGVPPAAGELLVPGVMTALAETHPLLRVNVVEGFSGFLYERLIKQEMNVALLHNPPPHRDVDTHPLLVESMYLIGPAARRGGNPPAQELSELSGIPLILPARPHSLRLLAEGMYEEREMDFNLRHEVDGLNLIRALVANGQGYTFLTYGSVHYQIADGRLSARRLEDPELSWSLTLASLADQRKSRVLMTVLEIIHAQVHELVDSGLWRGEPQYPREVDEAVKRPTGRTGV
jgi:LysR family transcriptional regulator, nitrogen assimilation regulatory protein